MIEKGKAFIGRAGGRFRVQAALAAGGVVLALGFWGIAFPQYVFTGDCVKILDKEGRDITDEAMEDKNLYREISNAQPEQTEIKISVLEWAKR